MIFPQRFAIMGMDGEIDKLVGVLNTIFKQYAQGPPEGRDEHLRILQQRPLTAEHAWPLAHRYPEWKRDDQMWRSDTEPGAKWLPTARIRVHVQPKCVCGPCNNGWMSAVESDAKPVLAALIGDFALQLDAEQQRQLAAWAIKSTMVWECTAHKKMFYSQAEREHLRLTRSLPPDTVVWLGRNERSDFTICHAERCLGPHRPILREGLVTTLRSLVWSSRCSLSAADSYPTGSIPPPSVRPARRQPRKDLATSRHDSMVSAVDFYETGLEDLPAIYEPARVRTLVLPPTVRYSAAASLASGRVNLAPRRVAVRDRTFRPYGPTGSPASATASAISRP
jgi:hypothetical protein